MSRQIFDDEQGQVIVSLFGERFVFRGEDPQSIKKAAFLVNEELDSIRSEFPKLGRHRVLILALMKLGENLALEKQKNQKLLERIAGEE